MKKNDCCMKQRKQAKKLLQVIFHTMDNLNDKAKSQIPRFSTCWSNYSTSVDQVMVNHLMFFQKHEAGCCRGKVKHGFW